MTEPTRSSVQDQQLREAGTDLDRRLRAGESLAAEAVLAAYPLLAADPDCALQLVYDELVRRELLGEEPAYEEYYQRFPQWREELRKSFEIHQALLHRGSEPLAQPQPHPPPRDEGAASDQPGERRYELHEELGRGGMGVVYKALQPGLKRVVALKMILAGEFADAGEQARFRREAETAARLQHPNIVQVYEVGVQDDLPFLAMEYVDGGSLAEWLKGGPLPVAEAARLTQTLARAVQYAHEHGVLHRDLKPANVLLGSSEREGRTSRSESAGGSRPPLTDWVPKIADFSLAKRLPGGPGALTVGGQTQTGAILGTPSYMSPEQAGGGEPVGPTADVWALGAILYELLTGCQPFRGETVMETLLQARELDPVPPRRLQPKVPRDLETICLKCLEKQPHKRYASAAELAEDLRRFLAGEATRARPVGVVTRSWKWARRRPTLAALVTVSLLAAGALVAVVLGYNVRLRANNETLAGALDATRAEKERAEYNYRLAREAVDDYASKVSADPRLQEDFRQLRKELLRTAVPFYEKLVAQRNDDPQGQAELASMCVRLAHLLSDIDDPVKAIEPCQQARDIYTKLLIAEPANARYRNGLAECLWTLGRQLQFANKTDAAEATYLAAIGQLKQIDTAGAATAASAQQARIWNSLGNLYRRHKQPDRAVEALREALRLHRELANRHPGDAGHQGEVVRALINFGLLYRGLGKLPEAHQSYQEAVACTRAVLVKDPQNARHQFQLAQCLNNLTFLLVEWDRPGEAEGPVRESLGLYRRLAERNPNIPHYPRGVALALLNLSKVSRALDRQAEAESALREALRVQVGLAAKYPRVPDHAVQKGVIASDLADLLRDTGRAEQSLPLFAEAVASLEAVLREEPKNPSARDTIREVYKGNAQALTRLKRRAEGDRFWDKALALTKGPERNGLRLARAAERARGGDHASATAEAAEVAKAGGLSGATLYHLAGVYALASAAGPPGAALHEEYARQALAFLDRARSAGQFGDPRQVERLKRDRDFDRMRSREAFQQFLGELEKTAPPG